MTPQDPLSALRDIHLPATGGFWPPAPGWWALAMILLVAVITLVWLTHTRRQKTRWHRQAKSELADLEQRQAPDAAWFAQLNSLLKRAARQRYPERHPEALSGEAWIAFLLEKAPGERIAARPVVEALVHSAWQPDVTADPHQALEFARRWLRRQS
ncbi:DUF4381 domain-containing protein [Marinobacter salinisoli]|uniref:DUF4381 domain-containing protein n=1 Tax=Marinobacter salinisoli TaxID=2769486 RepID=A0ABX7MPZ1_9GAMM|nr:DUF4381 domain-containing protein [Marinobacter salinisoli]QSP94363.1 DUF4381 domain-containing protein [Marinobacter salinisoli]